jgi:hypothetical protein
MEVNLWGYHYVNAPPIHYQDQNGDSFTNSLSVRTVPTFRSIDGSSSSILSWFMFSDDTIRASVSFYGIYTNKLLFCSYMNQIHITVDLARGHLNYLFNHLQQYYAAIKTKRQLDMEVPAGFQRSTVHRCIMGVTIIPPITIDDGDNNFSHFHIILRSCP